MPFFGIKLKGKKERLDLRITQDWTSKVRKQRDSSIPRSIETEGSQAEESLFWLFNGLFKKREHIWDAKEVVCSALQKTVESGLN